MHLDFVLEISNRSEKNCWKILNNSKLIFLIKKWMKSIYCIRYILVDSDIFLVLPVCHTVWRRSTIWRLKGYHSLIMDKNDRLPDINQTLPHLKFPNLCAKFIAILSEIKLPFPQNKIDKFCSDSISNFVTRRTPALFAE